MHSTHVSRWRYPWRMRVLAILLGLAPFIVFELSLRLLGLPSTPPPLDPFLDLHNLQPLFTENRETGRMEIGPERMHLFRPGGFPIAKPEAGLRIFALGGSTTQGEPYSTETAFPEWLKLNLQAALPQREIEVINAGGLSYASYRVLAILREVLEYDADMIVIYTGHNEYLEQRSYAGYHQRSFPNYAESQLSKLRSVQLIRSILGAPHSTQDSPVAERTELAAEVDALLDYQGGLADYHRGDVWYAPVPEHFRWNLEQMAVACQQAGVPLVLIKPVSNLLDCPPMKFELSPQLPEDACQRFEALWSKAKELVADDSIAARACLEQALAIDPGHAGARFLLGRLQFEAGQYEAARQTLTQAKDSDVCPLRAPTAIATAVEEIARRFNVNFLDAQQVFADRSDHGIVGERWLVDHIHPSVEGHQLLGEELAELLFSTGMLVATDADWQHTRRALYQQHLDTLSEAYFHRGKQRLEGLLLWTQGRAKKLRSPALE